MSSITIHSDGSILFSSLGQRRTQLLIKAMDSFHSFADWKAQSVQNGIEKLQKRKADYDRLQAEREDMKAKLNTCAIERAQRQEYKKEVGSCMHLLPSKFKLE